MSFNEKAWHVGFKWTIGDEDNPTGAICLDDSSDALHICEIADARTDWNVSTTSHPTLYVHSATTPATDYISLYHDGDYAYLGVDGTTLLTMTTTTLAIAVATTISGDLVITTDDIAVAQGYYMYFDGLGNATEYIRSDAADYMTMAATTGIDLVIGTTDEVAITASAVTLATNNLTLTAGHIAVAATKYIYLDGQGGSEHIRSTTAGKITITASGTSTDDITLAGTVTVSDDLVMGAAKDIRLKDSGALFFGDSDDVRVQWAAGILSFMPITDNTGMITFGTGGRQMDVRFYGAASNIYWDWDNSANKWVATSAHMLFQDGCHLYMGTANDIDMYWGSTIGWRIKYANHDTLNCEIGANSLNIDWKWWMGAAGYVLFDVGNLQVNLSGMDLVIAGLSNKLYFGSVAAGAYIWANTVDGRMDLVAPDGIYVNNHFRMVANYNLYLGNVDTAYFLNDTPGHMKGYGTQITFTTTLVNATALMLDAGTGGGGVAVRGYLRLWVTGSVGDTKGQIWYDSTSNKLHFWNGTAEQEVTSGGA